MLGTHRGTLKEPCSATSQTGLGIYLAYPGITWYSFKVAASKIDPHELQLAEPKSLQIAGTPREGNAKLIGMQFQ